MFTETNKPLFRLFRKQRVKVPGIPETKQPTQKSTRARTEAPIKCNKWYCCCCCTRSGTVYKKKSRFKLAAWCNIASYQVLPQGICMYVACLYVAW